MELNEIIWLASKDDDKYYARRLVSADLIALQQFGQSLSAEVKSKFYPHPYNNSVLKALLKRSEDGADLTMGLFSEKQMIAYFFLWYFNESIPLLGVGLHDSFQGKRLGKKLLQLLADEAKKAGCDGIELTTVPDNERAYSLYEKVGFKHYADVENLVGDGSIVIEKAMFLPLKEGVKPSNKLHKPPVDFESLPKD